MEFILQLLAEWILPEESHSEESFSMTAQEIEATVVVECIEEPQYSNIFSLVEFH